MTSQSLSAIQHCLQLLSDVPSWRAGLRRGRRPLLGLLLTAATLTPCQAEDTVATSDHPLTLGFVEFPPASYVDDAGQPAGHLLDLGQRALERAGYRWEAKHYPANRLAAYMGTGDVDLFLGVTTIPGFEGNILAGEMTIASIELRAYAKGEAPAVKSWEDLRGQIVIVLRGYSYGGWINKIQDPSAGIEALEVDDHVQALKVLNLGRGDILLDYKGPVEAALKQVEVPGLQSTLISRLECKFVVSLKAPEAEKLLRDLEAAFEGMNEGEAVF